MNGTLRILFFSSLIDIVGSNELQRTYSEEGSLTVAALLEQLYQEFPGLREWDRQILVSVDLEWVERSVELRDGQEVGIMPPVQGG